MPIDTISQIISTIPEAGHRGVDVQTQFVIKQEDFQDHLQGTTVSELNALKTQINTTVIGMNIAVDTVNTKASEASASASSASASSNTATTKAAEASASASSASASATKAGQWADANYNVQVETGKYSAKHWATEAQNVVTNKIDRVTSTDNAVVRFNGTTGGVQNSGIIIDDNNKVTIPGSSGNIELSQSGGGNSITFSRNGSNYIIANGGVNSAIYFGTGHSGLFYENTNMVLDTTGNLLLTSGTGALGYGTGAGGVVTQLTSKSTDVTLNKPSGRITMNNAALAAGASVSFAVNNSLYNAAVGDTITADAYMYGASYRVEHRGFAGAFSIRVTNISGGTLAEPLEINFTIIKGAIS